MPEFEENTQQPDHNKDAHQYQPSQSKTEQKPSHEIVAPTTGQPSNMRGRWKRSNRGPAKHSSTKKEAIEIEAPVAEINETYHEPQPHIEKEEPIVEEKPIVKKEHKAQHTQREKVTKPIDREKVFIPKTKEESERHKNRHSAHTRKKPSLWQKILSFLGFSPKPKYTRKHTEEDKHGNKSYSQKRSHPHSKKPSGKQSHPYKHSGRKGPKSNY